MAQFNPTLIDSILGPEASTFNSAEMPSLKDQHPNGEYWLTSFFLGNVVGAVDSITYDHKWLRRCLRYLQHAQYLLRTYEFARISTATYLEKSSLHSPAVSLYYECISLWQTAFLTAYLALDAYNTLSPDKAFTQGDGSADERIWQNATELKHPKHNDTLALWLTNTGFRGAHPVSYLEFAKVVGEICSLADELCKGPSQVALEGGLIPSNTSPEV